MFKNYYKKTKNYHKRNSISKAKKFHKSLRSTSEDRFEIICLYLTKKDKCRE